MREPASQVATADGVYYLMAARLCGALVLLFLLVAPAPAQADEHTTGPMTPLPSELLPQPIHLTGSCSGVVVREWHGDRSKKAIKLLDVVCRGAVAAFPGFAQEHGLEPDRVGRLTWSVALLPAGHCSRCMNDLEGRFTERAGMGDLVGYTARTDQYVFITSEIFDNKGKPKAIWVESWVHELWHALSQSSGVYYQQLWGDEDIDEQLAQKFVRHMLGA